MTLGDLATRCGGTLEGDARTQWKGFAWDSREVLKGQVFLAIRGARVDGHDFVLDALSQGAVAAIVERPVKGAYILVDDLVQALARLGRSFRSKFDGPVVGVTGSNGKTTTKEFTAAALSPLGRVLRSRGNQNTEYTMPLIWTELTPETRAAVMEMGMRGLGQIRHLASIARPTIGVVTMIGTAHLEMVGSREGIAQAKAELLEQVETAVLPLEDDFYGFLRGACRPETRVLTFGFGPDADCRILGYRALGWSQSRLRLEIGGETCDVRLRTAGRHQALNVAAAVAAAYAAGVPPKAAAGKLSVAELPKMRMEVFRDDGGTIFLDAYNASPESTIAALRTLREVPCGGRRLAVIGEMLELGDFAESGHRLVGRALAESDLDCVLLVGPLTRFIESEAVLAGMPAEKICRQPETDVAGVRKLVSTLGPEDVVLIKGSRALGLERALQPEGA